MCIICVAILRRLSPEPDSSRGPFHEEDEEIASSYLVWGGIALHYADMYHALSNQRNLHQFLLTVVKSIFQVSVGNLKLNVISQHSFLLDAQSFKKI